MMPSNGRSTSLFAKLELDRSISRAVKKRLLEMGRQIGVGRFQADLQKISPTLSVARCNKTASFWSLFAKERLRRRREICSDPE